MSTRLHCEKRRWGETLLLQKLAFALSDVFRFMSLATPMLLWRFVDRWHELHMDRFQLFDTWLQYAGTLIHLFQPTRGSSRVLIIQRQKEKNVHLPLHRFGTLWICRWFCQCIYKPDLNVVTYHVPNERSCMSDNHHSRSQRLAMLGT